jgi:hypothetical protein
MHLKNLHAFQYLLDSYNMLFYNPALSSNE